MKEVVLTRGKFAVVDDEDFEYINKFSWHYSHGYAMTDSVRSRIYMHRLINKTPEGLLTDHIDRNSLNNQKSNLRTVDKKMNSINRGLQRNNTSGYKGVTLDKTNNRWEARIKVNQKTIHLGRFKDIMDAVDIRKLAESVYFI